MIRSLLVLSVLTVVWVFTGHGVALVFLTLAAFWFAVEWLRDDPEPLAPYRYPGGDL